MDEFKRNYTIEQLKIHVTNDASTDRTYVVFSTLMETQYYSPGVKTSIDDKNNMFIEFVRAEIRDKNPQIDLKAEYLVKWIQDNKPSKATQEKLMEHSTSADQIFFIPGKIENIYVTNLETKTKIWEKSK
ncbi:hypothetical protein [Undibacterium sp.]|uniref:hypothetical protein n=1 Tax=Undibacterium sp. TaxID=1914977 RepID=UPI00374CCAF6